jgi:hypothetical protein
MGLSVGLDVFVKVTVKSLFTEWSYRMSRGMAPLILNLGEKSLAPDEMRTLIVHPVALLLYE